MEKNKTENCQKENYELEDWKLENKKFVFYYKRQLAPIIESEADFEAMMTKLKEKLPITIRINISSNHWKVLCSQFIDNSLISKLNLGSDLMKFEKKDMTNLELYRNTVFSLNIPRFELKKSKEFATLHQLIYKFSESGVISRQEAVSMIPPFVLGIEKGDLLFDMCAAPGSKTGQFLEKLYFDYDYQSESALEDDVGAVIANDNNFRRAHMMTYQLKRLNTAGMLIVNHDASRFPHINRTDPVFFDKILADVPCSSDAVLRKLPSKWKEWGLKDGNSLHKLQLNILRKGVALLKKNGLIVYSTCSLNPIENEAVVAQVMRENEGKLQIVDCSALFEGSDIKIRQGLLEWKVYKEKEGELVEAKLEEVDDKLEKSKFAGEKEELKAMGLNNCMRILPHDSDTSGFFITLFKRLVEPDVFPKKKEAKSNKSNVFFVNEVDKELLEIIKEKYGLKESFKLDQLVTLSDKPKKLNFISKGVKNLLDLGGRSVLTIVNLGVKMFELDKMTKNDGRLFRVCQDGIRVLLPFMSKLKYFTDLETFKFILEKETVDYRDIPDKKLVEDIEKSEDNLVVCYDDGKVVEPLCCRKRNYALIMMISKEDLYRLRLHFLNQLS